MGASEDEGVGVEWSWSMCSHLVSVRFWSHYRARALGDSRTMSHRAVAQSYN